MATPASEFRLYEIADDLDAVIREIIDNDGVLTEEAEERLENLEGLFQQKVENTALAAQELKRKAEAASEEAKRLRDLASTYSNAYDNLREYLREQMARMDVERVDGDRVKVGRYENSRPSITWTRDEEPPEPFRRVRISADTQAAYEQWKAGADLPDGFEVEVGEHVRIW